jgi:hypothetical protein
MATKGKSGINANSGIVAEIGIKAFFGICIDETEESELNDYDNEPELIFEWPAYRSGVTPGLKFGDITELKDIKKAGSENKFQQASLAANNVLLRSSLYPFLGQYIFRSGGEIPGLTLWELFNNASVEMYSSTAFYMVKV